VSSILNFAPTVISVPEGVSLRKVDLAVELQILSFYQQRREGGPESTDRAGRSGASAPSTVEALEPSSAGADGSATGS
jgi:redox-sensing transcriptional repressor